MGRKFKHYRNLLLIDSSEIELHKYRRVIDMFGVAEYVQAETNGASALYYLRHANPLPELVVASMDQQGHFEQFVSEYEKLPLPVKIKSPLVLLYDQESEQALKWKSYPQLKKPLCVPELCELKDWAMRSLN